MDWILRLIDKHTKDDGTLDRDALNAEIKAEFPKNAVPKDQYNAVSAKHKEASDTLTGLQAQYKELEPIQTKVAEYEAKVAALEAEVAKAKREAQVREALKDAGAVDVDYMAYKLGEVELDADGNAKDLVNKIKALKEQNPTQFGTESKAPDFKPLDNKLDPGKSPDKAASMEKLVNDAVFGTTT
jgi:predicted RNase H-like nuclease (RuvC/YqgF family)